MPKEPYVARWLERAAGVGMQDLLVQTLKLNGGAIGRTADALNISRATVRRLCRRYNIQTIRNDTVVIAPLQES